MSKITKFFDVYGMKCHSCEATVEEEINKLDGIFSVEADYKNSMVIVTFQSDICIDEKIKNAIESAGFSNTNNLLVKIIALSILVISMFFLGNNPLINNINFKFLKDTSFIILFIIGILSSLNCIGNCGDKIIKGDFKVSFLYNLGRVVSYTIIGGIMGAIGSVFSALPRVQGLLQVLAAIFIIIAGLNTVGIKHFQKISFPQFFRKNICVTNYKNPLVLGYLDGFLPCSSLQTMQLYALATGSFIMGASSMLTFALGTVPFMLYFNFKSDSMTNKVKEYIFKYSGLLIILLGIIMVKKGLCFL